MVPALVNLRRVLPTRTSSNLNGGYGELDPPASRQIPQHDILANLLSDFPNQPRGASSGNLWLFGGDGLDSTGQTGLLKDFWRYTP